jgi:hypothetical protein
MVTTTQFSSPLEIRPKQQNKKHKTALISTFSMGIIFWGISTHSKIIFKIQKKNNKDYYKL